MTVALWLLAVQGILGAFDTLYYHEWKARLPARAPATNPELKLHAARDFIYAILFCSLPWMAFRGLWAVVISALLLAEIAITLTDFVVEDRVRAPLGGVYAGERVTHAVMGIIYGAMLAYLLSGLWSWWLAATSIDAAPEASAGLRWVLSMMGVGVLLSGLRDMCGVLGLPHSAWPWREIQAVEAKSAQ
jgi:hypothetical protein